MKYWRHTFIAILILVIGGAFIINRKTDSDNQTNSMTNIVYTINNQATDKNTFEAFKQKLTVYETAVTPDGGMTLIRARDDKGAKYIHVQQLAPAGGVWVVTSEDISLSTE